MKSNLWLSVFCRLSSVVCFAAPIAANAQEPAAQHGMPQLDFANPLTISQIVWLVVIFAALYLLLSTWALPQVGRVLGDRAARIASDLDSARAAKAQADAAAAEAKEANRRAQAEAQSKINQAIDDAKQQAAAQAAALNQALEARLADSERTIADARVKAMAGLREIATAAATTMVTRLSGKPADAIAIDAAVGSLLDQRAA